MTPLRRVGGREVTTLEGLADEVRTAWAEALLASGGSQCGFCTPGIVMRLAAEGRSGSSPNAVTEDQVERGLLAHLCRCTGWQTIEEAARIVRDEEEPRASSDSNRDLEAAGARATLEGGAVQRVGADVVLGLAGFADDTTPPDASVAVPSSS
ncbi:MAG: 2Fe-2S iron-sulfur cluster-binding protein, partial [Acidimicrobiales bacterium]